MNERNCSVCSAIQSALFISPMLTVYTLYCLAGVWVRELTQESLLIEQGTELTFTLCNCSPPGLDLSLRHCLELPRSTPSLSLAQQESSSEHQCARGSAQGAGTAAGDRGSACQRWPQFLSVLSHREAQLQTLSFSCSRMRWPLVQGYSLSFLAQLLPAVWQNILTLPINPWGS